MLIWLILIPVLASALIGLCKLPARPVAMLSSLITLILGVCAVVGYDASSAQWNSLLGMDLQFTLAPPMARVMLLLTVIVTFATVLGTRAYKSGAECCCMKSPAPASWYVSALLISAGATGAFLSDNLIAFFAFHELALIPTFVMIGIYGRSDKRTIAWRATIYLGAASMILLTGLLLLGAQWGMTFSAVAANAAAGVPLQHASAIGALLLVGFGTLVSLFPFHSWAAPAYASAPTPVTMMHAGVLKKFGLYGLFMLMPALTPALAQWNCWLLVLLVGNVLWVGYVTVNQRRLDLMLGHSSVMHMGYIFLALAALVASGGVNPYAEKGAALLMLAHGLSIALLFLMAGQVENSTGTLVMRSIGGLGSKFPRWAFVFALAGFASIGLPGLANFPGELLVFFSGFYGFSDSFGCVQIATILCLWGLVISAVYMLRAYRQIFQGDGSLFSENAKPLACYETVANYVLLIALVGFGLRPDIILSLFNR